MNRILLAIVAMVTMTVAAQQSTTKPGNSVPTVEAHMKVLSEKLDLTGDQQAKIKPILQEMQDATQKLMQDESLSREERIDKVKVCREKADKETRKILNDEQKKKLDQLESEPHHDLHGNIKGTAAPAAQATQN